MSDVEKLSDEILKGSDQPTLYQRSMADAEQRDSEWLAKAAFFAVGTHGLGRLFGKNIYAEMANIVGSASRGLAGLGKEVDNIPRYIRSELGNISNVPLTRAELDNGIKLDSMPLIQDIAEAEHILLDPGHSGYRMLLNESFKDNFASLRTQKPGQSYLHKDMTPIKVQDILDNANDILGKDADPNDFFETKLLSNAVKRGWLTADQVLDPNLYRTAAGRLLDTRVFRPHQMLESVAKIVDPFGIVRALKGFTRSDRTVGVISSANAKTSDALFLSGNIYEYDQGTLLKTGTDKTLGTVNDSRYIAALLREKPDTVIRAPAKNTWEGIQEFLGVGPRFHERRTGAFQTARTFLKSLKAVATGEAEFYGKEYKYTHESAVQQILEPYTFAGTSPTGNDIVLGKFSHTRFLKPEDLTPKTGVFKGIRGAFRRFKAYAGLSSDIGIVSTKAANRARAGGTPIAKEDFLTSFGKSGIKSTEKVLRISGTPTGVTLAGNLEHLVRAKHYAASADPFDRLYDFTNWMTLRLNKLASSSLLGIGFRPTGNLLANTARVAAIPLIYYAAKEAAMYTNYAIGQVAGQGPIEYAADLYTSLRVRQQEAREKTGITDFANKFENQLFPGLNLGVLGSIGAGLAGILTTEATGSVAKGVMVAGAIHAAIGGSDVGQSADSLKREYSGEEKVAVRKNRWWLLGYQSLKGGQIDHYKPSWYVELKQKPYDTNIYGSEQGYWRHGSMLPTPSNWFGLRTLIDPYHVERMNYYDRPYPTTSKLFENVPIFGPILADTIGEIVKPTKQMHEDAQGYMIASSNISQKGIPTNAARELGIPEVPVSAIDLRRPDILKDRLQKYANIGLEPGGVWKFALSLFGVTFDQDYQLASANNMTSAGRRFYDANLGGLLGETEMLRRFMLAEYNAPNKINQQINPIPNTMPRWLPGSESENEKDRQHFIDFTRGDSFTKIPNGEFRLPGRGYESVNKLHSGVSGVYSDVDKYLILSDVAPFSQAYYRQQGIVDKMPLSPYWRYKVTQAQEQRKNKLMRFEFEGHNKSQDQLAQLNETAFTKDIRKVWTSISQEGLANIPIVGAKLFPYHNAYDQYLADVVEGDTFADWRNPYESIIRPAFYSTIGENPFFAIKRGFQMGALVSSPAAAFLNPFPVLTANPVAVTLGSAAIGGLGSTVRAISTGQFSHGFVPPHVKKERETSEYFDYLKYSKYRYLESQASEQGNKKLASVFASQARQTIAYGKAQYETTGSLASFQSALGRDERPYFDAFIEAPIASREKILKIVPEHMKQMLKGVWGEQANPHRKGSDAFAIADEAAVQYFGQHKLPNKNWAGWSPAVPDVAIKIKALDGHINGVSDNMHRFGIYPAQVKESRIRFPTLESPAFNVHDSDASSISLLTSSLLVPENGNPFSNVSHKRISHGIGPRLDWFSAQIEDSRRDRVFAFYTDAYR